MEERQLNFNRNEDPTIVEDPDGKMVKKIAKLYSDIKLNLGFCHEQLVAGTLTKGMSETHLSLTEHYVKDFLKEMGYDSILERESKERFSEIRSLNEQNRALRVQLGEKVSNEDFRERSKNLSKLVREWWNNYGFGHTSKVSFTEYGHMKIKFSGMITETYYNGQDKTIEEKLEYLRSVGFDVLEKDKDGDNEVPPTEKNIKVLTDLIKSKYPSAEIDEIVITPRTHFHSLRDITIVIRNLDDIE